MIKIFRQYSLLFRNLTTADRWKDLMKSKQHPIAFPLATKYRVGVLSSMTLSLNALSSKEHWSNGTLVEWIIGRTEHWSNGTFV